MLFLLAELFGLMDSHAHYCIPENTIMRVWRSSSYSLLYRNARDVFVGAAEVESRVRVDAGDIAQRDGLGGRAERDQPEQGVRCPVLHARAGRGDRGFEPEDDHARAESVADDVLLAGRVSEFGHGLCGFGHVLLLCFVLCLFFLSPSRFPYGVWDEETV